MWRACPGGAASSKSPGGYLIGFQSGRYAPFRRKSRRIPLLRSLVSVLASYDGAAELERGLDILLTGLTTTLTLRRVGPARSLRPSTTVMTSHVHRAGRYGCLSSWVRCAHTGQREANTVR